MIQLWICEKEMEVRLRGSDEMLLDELSTAVTRMLRAMERSEGRPVADNLTALILSLLEKTEKDRA